MHIIRLSFPASQRVQFFFKEKKDIFLITTASKDIARVDNVDVTSNSNIK